MSVATGSTRQLELHIPAASADAILKEKAHLAFLAHQRAVRDGDTELAAAALERFRTLSAHLAPLASKGPR